MNSKQLNFFLVPEDLPSVYDLFNRMDVRYVRIINNGSEDFTLETFPFRHGEVHEQIYITHIDFSSNIYLLKDRIGTGYSIDSNKSYVIQFTPGGFYPFSSRVLNRGGFYCTTSYFVSNGEYVAKPDEFKKWVDKLFKSFKKEFLVKSDQISWMFFSHRTIEWMKNTGAAVDKTFERIAF